VGALVASIVELPTGTDKVKVRGFLDGEGLVRLDDILLTVRN
jgi:hypothetical protein